MKRFIFIIAIIFLISVFVTPVNAQGLQDDQEVDYLFDYEENASYISLEELDILDATDSTYTVTVRYKGKSKLMPYVYCVMDSTGGTAASTTVSVSTKVSGSDTRWVPRESVTWANG